MIDALKNFLPKEYRLLSLGVTFGIVVGFLFAIFLPSWTHWPLVIMYTILTAVSVWGERDELKALLE